MYLLDCEVELGSNRGSDLWRYGHHNHFSFSSSSLLTDKQTDRQTDRQMFGVHKIEREEKRTLEQELFRLFYHAFHNSFLK